MLEASGLGAAVRSLIPEQGEDHVAEPAHEAAKGGSLGLAFCELTLEVRLCQRVAPDLINGDQV